ncbi:MAG: baseplate J/gp47 family protein, partial [Actinomycetota bacterium]
MTYVSEPYLHIADQVLTALTGGAAREVNRFLPQANSLGFERDASRIAFDTVTVLGQAHKEFFAFQQGRDYSITDGQIVFLADPEDVSKAASGATWPDEGSEFFVSYYHSDSSKAPLTDRNVGSLTRTLAESFARELAILQRQLELVYKSGFIDTAEGSALDMVVAILGVERKDRQFASGIVRFFRDSPAPADIFVPEGTLVSTSTDPVVAFTTNSPRTLRRGQLSVEAEVRAEEPGATGVVAAGAINVVNQTILGISGVTNESPTVFGGSAESDDELRGRAKKVLERVGRATPGAIMHSLTQVGGLKENEIKLVEELQLRPGVVKVFVARDPSPDLAADVQQAILESRAAGVRFEHNLDVALLPSPEGGLDEEDGREPGETELTGEGGDFRQSFCCDVFVFPQNPRVTGPERSAMESAIVSAVTSYIEAAPIGGTLVYNRVVGDIMAVAGVLDVTLNLAPNEGSAT